MEKPILSIYTDFRKFLEDYFLYKREQTKNRLSPYSYSDFSAAADIKSPNYLKMIIAGQRNLSTEMIRKFARALKLDKEQTNEFEILVLYGQEKDPLLRNKYLKQLSDLRSQKALAAGDIDADTWDKIPNWLSWVLYAMIDQENVDFSPKQLKKLLKNQASEKQIQQALEKLTASGDIKIDDIGEASKENTMISNADKIPPALVRKLQAELIYLGLESLFRDEPTEREISGFTLAMTEEEFQWVRHELRKVRKDLQSKLMMEREQKQGQRVYQVNVQLFPLTEAARPRRKKDSESPNTRDKDI